MVAVLAATSIAALAALAGAELPRELKAGLSVASHVLTFVQVAAVAVLAVGVVRARE